MALLTTNDLILTEAVQDLESYGPSFWRTFCSAATVEKIGLGKRLAQRPVLSVKTFEEIKGYELGEDRKWKPTRGEPGYSIHCLTSLLKSRGQSTRESRHVQLVHLK